MLVRDAIQVRLSEPGREDDKAGRVRLPRSLKRDRTTVRTAMFQRLAASRLFAHGDRAGVLRTAQARSGRLFRMDVRQRVIVKALVSKHAGKGAARGAALAQHIAYLGRTGAGAEGSRAEFFDREQNGLDAGVSVPHCPLTPRQLECLRWVYAGKTDHEISVLLGVSPRTVHNHVEAAKTVFNTPKRLTAAFEARRRGWLD